MADILYIVVPCYNEEEVLPETSRRLRAKLEGLHGECPLFCGADLSRNRGHQNALLAGLMTAKERCDMAISMDADLQDDIDAVDAMVEQYYAGCDVVYGVRSSRKKDTFFKRFTAEGFYRSTTPTTASCPGGRWRGWPGSGRSTCSCGASCP